jgi:pimeloyl-ACP methyl ester carboxylesterase
MHKFKYWLSLAGFGLLLAHTAGNAQALQATEPAAAPRGAYISPLLPGHHRVTLNGIATHYEVAGTGPLLVIQSPSWGIGSAYLFNGLAELAKNFTLLAYDVPGSGASDKPASGYKLTTTEIADQLEALRQYLKRDEIDLLGHSQGSALAMAYASRYPERVRRLVLVGSQLYGFPGDEEANALARVRENDPRFKGAIAARATPTPTDDAAYTRRFIQTAPYYLYDPKDTDAFVATLTKPLSAWPANAKSRTVAADDQQPDSLPLIKARTLVIDGLQDPVCPPVVSARIKQGIPGSLLLIYENTGHFPWIEQPPRFFGDVSRFLLDSSF